MTQPDDFFDDTLSTKDLIDRLLQDALAEAHRSLSPARVTITRTMFMTAMVLAGLTLAGCGNELATYALDALTPPISGAP